MDAVPAEAHWHAGQVENHARYIRMMENPTMEHMIIGEVDVQKLLDELTDTTTISRNTMDTCRDNGFVGSLLRVLGDVLEDNTDLPLLAFAGRFRKQAQNRHKCRMAAIEVEANTKIRKGLIRRFRPMSGDHVLGDDAMYYWRDVTCESHWC